MRTVFLVALLIQLSLFPEKYHIKKIWLFSRTQYAGNVPRPIGGKQLSGHSEQILCFIEIGKNCRTPNWQTAYFKGQKYLVTASKLNIDSVTAGKEKKTHALVVVKASPDTELVQLNLTLTDKDENTNAAGFELEGRFNKKHARLKPEGPVVELEPVFMP